MVPGFFALTYSWCCCSQLLWSCRKAHSRLTRDNPGIGVLSHLPVVHPRAPTGRTEMIHTTLMMASQSSEALSLPVQLPYQVVQC